MDPSDIVWVSNDGGIVTIGGSRRGVLFGQIGPRHECLVPSFEITSQVFTVKEIQQMFPGEGSIEDILFDHSLRFPTEGEWELAFKNKQLEPTRMTWAIKYELRPKNPYLIKLGFFS